MATVEKKSLDSPDETQTFNKGKLEFVTIGDTSFSRATFEPGWKWSNDVKTVAKTESCEVLHKSYVVSGRLHIKMDDGSETEITPGDAAIIPPGHDAWVVGDEPFVAIDSTGTFAPYAKPAEE